MTHTRLVREGRVVYGDGATAELLFSTPCRTCPSRCLLGRTSEHRVHIAAPASWKPMAGERVQVAVSRSELTRLCAVLFALPVVAWAGGGVVGSHLWGEAGGVLGAVVMLAGALLAISLNGGSLRRWLKLELSALHDQHGAGR